MENNQDKIKELEEKIKGWREELDTVWAGKNTDAAEVERRNLKSLINEAKKEIDKLSGKELETENLQDPKEFLNEIKEFKRKVEEFQKVDEYGNVEKFKELTQVERNRLKLSLEKLTEEREMYESQKNGSYKDIYKEYTERIDKIKEELELLDEMDRIYEDKDRTIRTLTQGRMDTEKEINDIEKKILAKQKEIADIEYGTAEALEEKELSDGSKTQVPKVLRLYNELEELKGLLKEKEELREEFQKYINEVKGIEQEEHTEYTTQQNHEYTRFFHGQGDTPERVANADKAKDKGGRDDRRGNDEYFGFENNGPRGTGKIPITGPKPGPKPTKDPKDPVKDPKDPVKDPKDPVKDPKDPVKDPKDPTKDPKDPTKDPIDPVPGTIYTAENQRKLDLIAQSEIEHINTWDTIMRNNARAKVFTPWNIGSATAVAGVGAASLALGAAGITVAALPVVAGVAAAPMIITTAMKLTGKLNNLIRGTNAKEQRMRDRIEGMEQEDFDLLVTSIDENDMVTEKYGEVWLECVRDRLQRENEERVEMIKESVKEELKIQAECLRDNRCVPEDVRAKLAQAEKDQSYWNAEVDRFNTGILAKSHRRMNIRGRIFGVFNPDRTEFNKEAAELHRDIINATSEEERLQAVNAYEEYRADQVDVMSFAKGKIVFDRGILHKAQDIEILEERSEGYNPDRREPQFMKRLANLVMRAGAMLTITNGLTDQELLKQQEAAINQNINNANSYNTQIEQILANAQKTLEGAPTEEALDDYTKLLINDAFLQGHNRQFILDQLGRFDENGSDALLHQELADATQQFLKTASFQDKQQFLQNVVIPMWQKNSKEILSDQQAIDYIRNHPEYNMNALWTNTRSGLHSGLDSVPNVLDIIRRSANSLKGITTQKLGNVSISIPTHLVTQVLTNGSAILSTVKDSLNVKKKVKAKDQPKEVGEENPVTPEEQAEAIFSGEDR